MERNASESEILAPRKSMAPNSSNNHRLTEISTILV